MADKRYDRDWEERKNQDPKQKEGRGSKEEADSQMPYNRMKDGTNDVQNKDADLGEPSEKSSADNPEQKS